MVARRRPRPSLLLAPALLLAACGSTAPDYRSRDGLLLLRDMPTAPYRIGVLPLRPGTVRLPAGALTPEHCVDFRDRLVTALQGLASASDVVPLPADADPADLRLCGEPDRIDLAVVPTLRSPARTGDWQWSGQWWLSGVLWLTTWFGGLAVEDAEYQAEMAVDFEVYHPAGRRRIAVVEARSSAFGLNFWDRHRVLSFGTLQSLVLPPFLTSDDRARTEALLWRRTCEQLGARLTGFLKEDLLAIEKSYLGDVKVEPLEPGPDPGSFRLPGRLVAGSRVEEFRVDRDAEADVVVLTGADMPDLEAQRFGDGFRFAFAPVLTLQPGQHRLRLWFFTEGPVTTRTLLVTAPGPGAER